MALGLKNRTYAKIQVGCVDSSGDAAPNAVITTDILSVYCQIMSHPKMAHVAALGAWRQMWVSLIMLFHLPTATS